MVENSYTSVVSFLVLPLPGEFRNTSRTVETQGRFNSARRLTMRLFFPAISDAQQGKRRKSVGTRNRRGHDVSRPQDLRCYSERVRISYRSLVESMHQSFNDLTPVCRPAFTSVPRIGPSDRSDQSCPDRVDFCPEAGFVLRF